MLDAMAQLIYGGELTAISIHACATDITRVGSSARRYYD
jgi:hypothetical protein